MVNVICLGRECAAMRFAIQGDCMLHLADCSGVVCHTCSASEILELEHLRRSACTSNHCNQPAVLDFLSFPSKWENKHRHLCVDLREFACRGM